MLNSTPARILAAARELADELGCNSGLGSAYTHGTPRALVLSFCDRPNSGPLIFHFEMRFNSSSDVSPSKVNFFALNIDGGESRSGHISAADITSFDDVEAFLRGLLAGNKPSIESAAD